MGLKECMLSRIKVEPFIYIKSIPEFQKPMLRNIFYNSIQASNITEETALDENIIQLIASNISLEFGLLDWQSKRLAKTEFSKFRTLGFIDLLNSEGIYNCRVSTGSDGFDDCIRLIDGKTFETKTLLDNVYKNYNLKHPMYPAVPLHPNCNHYIIRP